MHRFPHIREATWDISGGFQSKVALIMQLTDERSLGLLVKTETRLPGGIRFTEKVRPYERTDICDEIKLSTQYQKKWKYGKTAMRNLPQSLRHSRLAQTAPSPETWTPRCIEMLSHDQ